MKNKKRFQYNADGTLKLADWLHEMQAKHQWRDATLLQNACLLAEKATPGVNTFYGKPCLEEGLITAETLLDLKMDQETAAAAIASFTHLTLEAITRELGAGVAKLVQGVRLIDVNLQNQADRNQTQIDKVRKMLLAIATDLRVVLIKLAERLSFMRGIKTMNPAERKVYAKEIMDIYAPLANRLGIGQLKWELEDVAFHYLDPELYKTIAGFLAERRTDRENRIHALIDFLKMSLQKQGIKADVTGRAKHIYSIYAKAKRNHLSYQDLYDYSAVRILVPTVSDCYTALSFVHGQWSPIMKEFDDYIAKPKPNGYSSIHTAVIGDDGKHFEIQIRTHQMHEEAERGVAAHWMYKEQKNSAENDLAKINYLRQLIDWHREISPQNTAQADILEQQIYVVTPAGDILDLPTGATPIDFAYHIHSELGHRCRGAKVNGHIVPLTHALKTGDKVEIITMMQATPSRDWLNAELGYVKSSRARSKISHWFKQLDFKQDITDGRQLLERELARHGLSKTLSLAVIAKHFHVKDEDTLLASIAHGSVRVAQVIQLLHPSAILKSAPLNPQGTRSTAPAMATPIVGSAADFLTVLAKCCKPKQGDEILGYITRGRGISVHRKDCKNVKNLTDMRRFFQINWDAKKK